jgi:hypothetical protein
MEQRTKEALQDLRHSQWFNRVGDVDSPSVRIIKSWEEAAILCSNIDWENVLLDGANGYRDRLREVTPRLLDTWNDRVARVRPECDEIARVKTLPVRQLHNMPAEFEWAVRWDIINYAMECEYADVCSPGFFTRQAYWYLNGHFPCGWEGPFPQGRLIIY